MPNPVVLGGLLPGPREWLLVALVALALFGRSGSFRHGLARAFRPWKETPGGRSGRNWPADRWFWLAALAVAALVAGQLYAFFRPTVRP